MFTQDLFNTAYEAWQEKARKAAGELTAENTPLLRFLAQDADMAPTLAAAKALHDFAQDVVVVGTGGSSLGARTLYDLRDTTKPCPRMHFLENVDPESTARLFASLDWKKTGFLLVSKSGNTLETLTQTLLVLKNLDANGGDIAKQCLAISDPKDSALRQIATKFGITVLDHEAAIGGRYSVLTNVGLLPAAIAGLDIAAIRAGAKAYAKNPAAIADASAWHMAVMEQKKSLHVLMPYAEKLQSITSWHRQLWAESLGKDGKGTTPIRAIGTVDQHSQIQLYLAGPKDKAFTFLSLPRKGTGEALMPEKLTLPDHPELAYLKGRTLGDISAASEEGTIGTFKAKGLPVRVMALPDTKPETIGALLMHFMLETIITAALLGVDPYDQPAVEDGKLLTRKILRGG